MPANRLKFLVTGAAGFIGSHLCEGLVAEGHSVVGFDDLSDGSEENLSAVPEVDLEVADLRDADRLRRATRGADVILHHGAKRSVPRSILLPALTNDVNVAGTINVLIAAQEAGARVVSASSSSVYGDQDEFPLRESMYPRPRSPYAASKLAGEAYCYSWWRSHGVPAVSLRYFNVYGPRQDPASEYAAVIPRFIEACLGSYSPVIHGDGEQARDFTYIADVVEANLLASRAREEAFGRTFNIGGGAEPTSILELLQLIARVTGAVPEPIHEPPRDGDVRRTEADISSAKAMLGFKPSVSIEDGVGRTVEWFRDREGGPSGGHRG